eukprot:COSAG06_NODE_15454_length_1070_cov_0.949537_1_plen_223_part_10
MRGLSSVLLIGKRCCVCQRWQRLLRQLQLHRCLGVVQWTLSHATLTLVPTPFVPLRYCRSDGHAPRAARRGFPHQMAARRGVTSSTPSPASSPPQTPAARHDSARHREQQEQWQSVWPTLRRRGWKHQETASQNQEVTSHLFFPPGVTRDNGIRRVDYFDSKKAVLQFLQAQDKQNGRSREVAGGSAADLETTIGRKIAYRFEITSAAGEKSISWEHGTVRAA